MSTRSMNVVAQTATSVQRLLELAPTTRDMLNGAHLPFVGYALRDSCGDLDLDGVYLITYREASVSRQHHRYSEFQKLVT